MRRRAIRSSTSTSSAPTTSRSWASASALAAASPTTIAPGNAPVAVVSRRMAERLWPGQDPVGQRLPVRRYQRARHLDHRRGRERAGAAPRARRRSRASTSIARTRRSARPVRGTSSAPGRARCRSRRPRPRMVGAIDPNQSFLDVLTYDQRIANRMWQRRLAGALFGIVRRAGAAAGRGRASTACSRSSWHSRRVTSACAWPWERGGETFFAWCWDRA